MDKDQLCALVERAKQKDAGAFAELYAVYYKALYKTAYYLMGNPQDAEDVVMETVADAYAGISGLRAPGAFEGWIYKILYNKARRRRGYLARRATVELNDELADDSRLGEQVAQSADLLRALDALRPQERAILVLAVCAGYSSKTIGEIMRLNPNTVRSKQMRALAKLKALLEEEGQQGGKS